MNTDTDFPQEQLIKIYQELQNISIKIWIDGGWGIDILLGKKTRNHSDLDIVIESQNIEKLRQYLERLGYSNYLRADTSEWNFVMNKGKLFMDIHVIEFDDEGNGIYGPKERNVFYPNYAFSSTVFEDIEIFCISPKYQIESHQGYILREKDYIDIELLGEKFPNL